MKKKSIFSHRIKLQKYERSYLLAWIRLIRTAPSIRPHRIPELFHASVILLDHRAPIPC